MDNHPVDEMTEGCRFCAGKEYPTEIEFSCGWCGRKKVFRLVEEEKETAALPPTGEVAAVPVAGS